MHAIPIFAEGLSSITAAARDHELGWAVAGAEVLHLLEKFQGLVPVLPPICRKCLAGKVDDFLKLLIHVALPPKKLMDKDGAGSAFDGYPVHRTRGEQMLHLGAGAFRNE